MELRVTQILPPEEVRKFESEYGILHLIYHRNFNQHRSAVWWKHLNMLHRTLRKLLRKIHAAEIAKRYAAKEKLSKEAIAIAHAILKKRLFTASYYSLNSMIALGQFVNLGLATLANISALFSIVKTISTFASASDVSKIDRVAISTPSVVALPLDDLGEEIEYTGVQRTAKGESNLTEKPVKHSEEKAKSFHEAQSKKGKDRKKNSKRDKKKKTAIDDIFG